MDWLEQQRTRLHGFYRTEYRYSLRITAIAFGALILLGFAVSLLLPDLEQRTAFIDRLRKIGINTVFHYIPLHSAPAGLRYARAEGELPVTSEMSDRLVRLPLWVGLAEHQDEVIEAVLNALG